MPGLLFQITSFAFFAFVFFNSVSWLKLWEDKEFKWKRIFIHLKDTRQGRNILFGHLSLIKLLLVFAYIVTIYSSNFDYYYHLAVFALYFFLIGRILLKIYEREFFFPTFSTHSLIILSLTLAFEIVLFIIPPLDRFLWMVLLDRIVPLIIGFLVLLSSVFFDFNTDITINKALKKIQSHKNLLVVAVVGSYGKGTTKEFISRMMAAKFNVLETKISFNTPLGIAKTIIKEMTPKKNIFIAEMEDYKFGEIQEMCNITIPKIVVVTGINNQSMSMFGTFQKLLESKFQAIESLPKDGISLFNGNSPSTLSLYERTKNKKFVYATDESEFKAPSIRAFNIKETRFGTSFNVEVFGKRHKIAGVKLLGRQSVENLLPAIFIGLYMGMDFSLIRKLIGELKPLPGTMNPRITFGKTVLIDDTYNSNFNSVVRALDYMKVYQGKKIFVMEPLIELGKNAKLDHLELGEKIGKVCDFLLLTNNNYFESLILGIKNSGDKCKTMILPPAKIGSFVEKYCGKQDVVVFEGRGAKLALSVISSDPVF